MAEAKIIEVPPGSVIVLTGISLPYDKGKADTSPLTAARAHIAESIGHSKFAIVAVEEDGGVHVADKDEVIDLIAKAS
jgi:hypothetical protein